MVSALELRTLAIARLEEATALYTKGYYEGTYYLGGYAIEFALKAVICKLLKVELFETGVVSGNVLKAFQTHDLSDLTALAGLKPELQALIQVNHSLNKAWSKVSQWTEPRRYDFGCTSQTAKLFLNSVKIVLRWIEQHW